MLLRSTSRLLRSNSTLIARELCCSDGGSCLEKQTERDSTYRTRRFRDNRWQSSIFHLEIERSRWKLRSRWPSCARACRTIVRSISHSSSRAFRPPKSRVTSSTKVVRREYYFFIFRYILWHSYSWISIYFLTDINLSRLILIRHCWNRFWKTLEYVWLKVALIKS